MTEETSVSRQVLAIAVVAVMLSLAALFLVFTQQSQQIEDSVRCQRQDSAEARQAQRTQLEKLLTAHGLPILPPDVYAPPIPSDPKACDRFIKNRGVVPVPTTIGADD